MMLAIRCLDAPAGAEQHETVRWIDVVETGERGRWGGYDGGRGEERKSGNGNAEGGRRKAEEDGDEVGEERPIRQQTRVTGREQARDAPRGKGKCKGKGEAFAFHQIASNTAKPEAKTGETHCITAAPTRTCH